MIYPQIKQKLNKEIWLKSSIKNIIHIFTLLIVIIIFYI